MTRTSEAEAALKTAVSRLDNMELRTVEVRSGISAEDDGTRVFEALNRALADIPPERFAGAVIVSDGQIHDAPADLAKSAIGGPVHGLITGSKAERDRKVVIDRAPRFGMVGKEQTITFHVEEHNGPGQPVDVAITSGKGDARTMTVMPGQAVEVTIPSTMAGRTSSRSACRRSRARFRARTTAPSPWSKACATGFGCFSSRRAASGRAHLAQPAESRCLRRSRAFHHSSPAGEAGRNAHQGTGAHRLPDARTLHREARRVRSGDLRPLPAARRCCRPCI